MDLVAVDAFPIPLATLFSHLFVADLDDASHTDENEGTEPERQSGSGLDLNEFPASVSRHVRKRRLGLSETDSEEDELRSLDECPVETHYVMQQEEEFGSVSFFFFLNTGPRGPLAGPEHNTYVRPAINVLRPAGRKFFFLTFLLFLIEIKFGRRIRFGKFFFFNAGPRGPLAGPEHSIYVRPAINVLRPAGRT